MRTIRMMVMILVATLAFSALPSPAQAATVGRIAVIAADGTLLLKEPGLTSAWIPIMSGMDIHNVQLSGNRIGVLERGYRPVFGEPGFDRLWIKEGPANAPWKLVAVDVQDYALADSRVVVKPYWLSVPLFLGIMVKEGSLDAPWQYGIAFAVGKLDVSPHRLATTQSTGEACPSGQDLCWPTDLKVKEGSLGGAWTTVMTGISAMTCTDTCTEIPTRVRVTDDRLAIGVGDRLWVKEGPLNAVWSLVSDTADTAHQAWALRDNRICVVNGTNLICKTGPVTAGWVTVAAKAERPALADGRIGWLKRTASGEYDAYVAEGALTGPVSALLLAENVQELALQN